MNDADQNIDKNEQASDETHLKKDPRTGFLVLDGPKFTKEDVGRDFPVDCCRSAIVLRRSVGLGKKDPFESDNESTLCLNNKEQMANILPRNCCRFARFMRRSAGIIEIEDGLDNSAKCCFAE